MFSILHAYVPVCALFTLVKTSWAEPFFISTPPLFCSVWVILNHFTSLAVLLKPVWRRHCKTRSNLTDTSIVAENR